MSNGKIDCYVDIGTELPHGGPPLLAALADLTSTSTAASFYSYIAFVDILKNQALLQSHGVDVE